MHKKIRKNRKIFPNINIIIPTSFVNFTSLFIFCVFCSLALLQLSAACADEAALRGALDLISRVPGTGQKALDLAVRVPAETPAPAPTPEKRAAATVDETHDTGKEALDIATALPAQNEFVARMKESSLSAAPTDTTVTSVGELFDLMKQASELNAMLEQEETTAPAASAQQNNLNFILAMNVVARVPEVYAIDPRQMLNARKLYWPVDGYIFSAFNASRGKKLHGAIDIVAAKGTPIAVAAPGTVAAVSNGGRGFTGYGKVVVVDHGKGVHTLYSHCDSILVKMGQKVKQGEVIATVGRTGRATNNLLHFEVRIDGKRYDPLAYLPERPDVVKAVNWKSSNGKKK